MSRDTQLLAAAALAVLAGPLAGSAQTAAPASQGASVKKEQPLSLRTREALKKTDEESLYRFTIGPTLNFGVSASFHQLGASAPRTATTPGNRQYDDGWVINDPATGIDGKTADWGFLNNSQLTGTYVAPANVAMHRSWSAQDGSSDSVSSEANLGFDLGLTRKLGHLGKGDWGLAFNLGYSRIGVRDARDVTSGGYLLTDNYNPALLVLPVPVPPAEGYPGTVAARLPVAPTSSTTTYQPNSVLVSGNRHLDCDLVGAKLGPYIEYPLTERFLASLSAGLALAYVGMDYQVNETSVNPSMGPLLDTAHVPGLSNTSYTSERNTGNVLRAGAFAQIAFTYQFTKQISGFIGGEYQYLGNANRSFNGRDVSLDLGKVVFLKLGAGYSF